LVASASPYTRSASDPKMRNALPKRISADANLSAANVPAWFERNGIAAAYTARDRASP
jgi:hypothetical protein